MSAGDLLPFFEERFSEVSDYLDLLEQLDAVTASSGTPRLAVSNYRITTSQQRILYSSVYLQLYNLVEATVARCVSAVTDAATSAGHWLPHQLNEELQREWVRAVAQTHVDMTPEKRLKFALELSNHITNQLPIAGFVVDTGGGGNWDDEAIFKVGKRLGCRITNSPEVSKAVKSKTSGSEHGPLKLVKLRRNDLAHGSLSFVECAQNLVVRELRENANQVGAYLREVIECFTQYINSHAFLRPAHQPSNGAA
ncbi:MAE_28990/MAE_18760 family HEPN-like nuclease [Micromonospora sp. NPDC049645]|uniref:MAE_28990/MAE_18760 family HEPN-like nuclease n=1 Tax=Micromonospora sp. NPDC049645 TaxID=3155508 RepID=UPI00341714D1